MIQITNTIAIDESELEEKFIRSPGAGGQRVNKVATGVQLRFDARGSAAISQTVFQRLKTLAGQRMTNDGVLMISATSFRTQELNRKDARDRLIKLIAQACVVPKRRRATKPTRASKLRRLDQKSRRGDIKKNRGRVRFD